MPEQLKDLIIENARVVFRNFAGRAGTFNSEGDRNFCIMLDQHPQALERMQREGWNIKYLKPRQDDEGAEPTPYVQVAVNYGKGRPPRCVLISKASKNRTDLGAEEVALLDAADVETWDIVLNPYPWEVNGNKGIKAYLKALFATLEENELDLKYAQAVLAPSSDDYDEFAGAEG